MESHEKPTGFEGDLGSYGIAFYDGNCGEPIAWGFKIIRRLGDERFNELRKFGPLECIYPDWYLVTKTLSREEAIKKYGDIKEEVFGPKGGWKSVTFGEKKFVSKLLKP